MYFIARMILVTAENLEVGSFKVRISVFKDEKKRDEPNYLLANVADKREQQQRKTPTIFIIYQTNVTRKRMLLF